MNLDQHKNKGNSGKVLAGLILLLIGGGLLLQQITWFVLPGWVTSWEMAFIVISLYVGARNNFKPSVWVIFFIIGFFNLFDEIWPGLNIDRVTFPLIIIAVGLWMVLRRNQKWGRQEKLANDTFVQPNPVNPLDANGNPVPPVNPNPYSNPFTSAQGAHYGDSYLDSVSVFSGGKKTILSKDFKGGEAVTVFGGTELNLTMADFTGRVVIEVTQVFGGTKIIVPPHWQVVSDVASVFAGVDDKRHIGGAVVQNADKILVIKGTSIFGGIEIRSF